MSVRIGESWTTRNGHRRWITMGLGTYLLGGGLWALFALPFVLCWWLLLAELWVCAEVLLLAVTGIVAVVGLARREVGLGDVTVTWLRWNLFIIDLKGSAAP
jgi:hypothetical protein